MSGAHPPLTDSDVIHGLKVLGFSFRSQKGSHEQWIRNDHRGFFKVTVDRPKAPFGQDLIKSMASQAGVSKNAFYKACGK